MCVGRWQVQTLTTAAASWPWHKTFPKPVNIVSTALWFSTFFLPFCCFIITLLIGFFLSYHALHTLCSLNIGISNIWHTGQFFFFVTLTHIPPPHVMTNIMTTSHKACHSLASQNSVTRFHSLKIGIVDELSNEVSTKGAPQRVSWRGFLTTREVKTMFVFSIHHQMQRRDVWATRLFGLVISERLKLQLGALWSLCLCVHHRLRPVWLCKNVSCVLNGSV